MIIRGIDVDSPLNGLVDVLWYFDTSSGKLSHVRQNSKEKVLPTGTFEFVFNLSNDRIHVYGYDDPEHPIELSGAIICGVHSRYFLLDSERNGRVVGAHFKPGGIYPLLRQSAAELTNRHINLEEIFGPSAGLFRRGLALLNTEEAIFNALEGFLVKLINPRKIISPSVARLLEAWEVNPFCKPSPGPHELNITQKGLIGAFKRQVGLTPKKYSCVLRFQAVLKEIESGQVINWADIALRCGYYDQAHFGRDFRSFSGFSPGEYRARVGPNPNHVVAY